MAMKVEELQPPHGQPDHLLAYYRHIRDNDLYTVYAVLPPRPPGIRRFTNGKTCRCPPSAWCARRTMAW